MADFPGLILGDPGVVLSSDVLSDWRALILGVGSGAGASAPPVVVFENPLPGTPISATQVITLTVTDPDGAADILLLCLTASLVEGKDEVIFKDGGFTPSYSGTATPITNGTRFVITRVAGWTSEVFIDAKVADSGGNLT
jgi:hypothetical protein